MANEEDFEIEDGVLKKYKGEGGDVVIPEGVTEIGEMAFKDCESLASVVISEGVTKIGRGAFHSCSSLESVVIPKSVTEIGEQAFKGCAFPENFKAEIAGCRFENLLAIKDGVVLYCTNKNAEKIVIPEGVTEIGKSAFRWCKSLASVVIPEGVTEIGENAFEDCESLSSVVIPEGVTEIGKSAFSGCKSLVSVVIPEGVTKIGGKAFEKANIETVDLPQSLEVIGDYAFSESSLNSVEIPSSVKEIGMYAFYNTEVELPIKVPRGIRIHKQQDDDSGIGYGVFECEGDAERENSVTVVLRGVKPENCYPVEQKGFAVLNVSEDEMFENTAFYELGGYPGTDAIFFPATKSGGYDFDYENYDGLGVLLNRFSRYDYGTEINFDKNKYQKFQNRNIKISNSEGIIGVFEFEGWENFDWNYYFVITLPKGKWFEQSELVWKTVSYYNEKNELLARVIVGAIYDGKEYKLVKNMTSEDGFAYYGEWNVPHDYAPSAGRDLSSIKQSETNKTVRRMEDPANYPDDKEYEKISLNDLAKEISDNIICLANPETNDREVIQKGAGLYNFLVNGGDAEDYVEPEKEEDGIEWYGLSRDEEEYGEEDWGDDD